MNIKKAKYNYDNGVNFEQIMFETTADQVILTDGNNLQEFINQNMLEEKKSAYNKHFGIGPDTVSEGDHNHYETDLRFDKIEKQLNLVVDNSNKQELFIDITPSTSMWSKTSSSRVTNEVIEEGRLQFTSTSAGHGLSTSTLTDLIPNIIGKEIALSCNIETTNTTAYIKLRYNSGWEFLRMESSNDKFKTIKVKEGLIDFKLSIENKSTTTNDCVVTALKLKIKNSLQINSNFDIPDRNYSIWSWKKGEVLNPQSTMEFLRNYKINRIYQWFSSSLTHENIRNYAKVLQENNISINWLTGDPTWSLIKNHSKIIDAIRKINDYNKSINNGYQKIGTVQFDLEPYTLPEWTNDEARVIEEYQEAVKLAYDECGRLGLSLAMCVPHWFDSREYNNKFGSGLLYDFVSKHSNCTVIMSYSIKNFLTISEKEIQINKDNRRRLGIGFETKAVGDHGLTTDETFGDKPLVDLYNAFEILYQYQNTIGFDDRYEFAIHDFEAFKIYTDKFNLTIKNSEGAGPLLAEVLQLNTTSKTVIGAINELNTKLEEVKSLIERVRIVETI